MGLLNLKKARPFLLSLSLLTAFSCSNEEEIIEITGESAEIEAETSARVSSFEGKTYFIKSVNSNHYLQVQNNSKSNGANIQQWRKTGGTGQQWQVISVGSKQVRFKNVRSGKSLETKGGSNSNGANVEQRAYDNKTHQKWEIFSVGSGQYRIKNRDSGKSLDVKGRSKTAGATVHQWAYGGGSNQKWIFEEVGGSSSGDGGTSSPPSNGGSGSAAAIIGGMGSRWKLNAFSGSLNIGRGSYGKDGANGLDYKDRASTSDNNNWFFDTSGYAAFKCHVGNPTSNGSGNMRSELRELDGSGDEIEWNGTTGTNHRMNYKVNIRRMPTSGKLCFGQIHGQGNFDDVIRVQIDDSNANRGATSGKTSGTYDLQIKGYVTETLDRDNRNKSWARIQMKKEYDVEVSMQNQVVKVKLDGRTIYTSKKVNSKDNYFKAGAYLQSSQSDKSPQLKRNSNNFGEVWIKNLSVRH